MHPDKNHAPNAQEAFKMVGKAYGCLSDAQKRKHYDMFGKESDQHQGFGDINPDEIFKQFFGNGGIEEIFAHSGGTNLVKHAQFVNLFCVALEPHFVIEKLLLNSNNQFYSNYFCH